jgi:type IV pilus assembly protein PilX
LSPAAAHQRGAVLAVSLIFLLLLSIVAISLMRSGQLEVLMAGNAQSRLGAYELAEGIAESALARWEDNLNSKRP